MCDWVISHSINSRIGSQWMLPVRSFNFDAYPIRIPPNIAEALFFCGCFVFCGLHKILELSYRGIISKVGGGDPYDHGQN